MTQLELAIEMQQKLITAKNHILTTYQASGRSFAIVTLDEVISMNATLIVGLLGDKNV